MTDGLFILCLFPNTTMDPFYPLLAFSRNGPQRTKGSHLAYCYMPFVQAAILM